MPITVLAADDHPVYLDGIVDALGRDAQVVVVAVCRDGASALEHIRRLRPDVAVLDLRMPGPRTAELITTLADEGLPTRVVVLSAHTDSDLVLEVLDAGAAGFIDKGATRQEI